MKMTLTRALIAICVIVILAAILFPVFFPLKAGRNVVCISNVRQLAMAMLTYDYDDDTLPPAKSWMDAIEPVMHGPSSRVERMFHCPQVYQENRFAYGYAMETQLGGKNPSSLDDRSKEPMVFDSYPIGRNAHTRRAIIPTFTRHGGQNIAYADGHAKFVKSQR